MRVQSIIRELRGEKIDIIEYSEEITTFAEKALQPAKVSRVSIVDLAEKQLEVIVDDTQLSLAIGKKGQNVRLAAKLLGWKIDIKSEEEKRQEVEAQMTGFNAPATAIEQVTELGASVIEKLVAAGITTVESLADMTPEELEAVPGIGEKTIEKISTAVRHYFGMYEEGEERPPAPEPVAAPVAAESASEEESTPASEEIDLKTSNLSMDEINALKGRQSIPELVSAEELTEEENGSSDAISDADAREESIELNNDAVDELVNDSQENSSEGID
jgi:N utilization substance protein A